MIAAIPVRRALATCALFAFAACSGGGGGTPESQTNSASGLSYGKLVLAIPAAASATSLRSVKQREFLSPSAVSVSVTVTGSQQPVIADISASSPDCTSTSTTRTCAVPLGARVGTDTFVATLFSGSNATGEALGTGTVTQMISNGTPFSLSIDVSGIAASIAITAINKQFAVGVPATTALTIAVSDAGGSVISGTYEEPITLTNSDTTGTFSISPSTVTSSSTAVTLTYSGGTAATTATISGSAQNVPSTSVSAQVVTAGPPGTPTATPTASPTPAPTPNVTPTPAGSPTPTPKATATPTVSPTPSATPIATPTGGSTLHIYGAQLGASSITLTPIGANGNIAPTRTVIGDATGISQIYDTAVDHNGLMYASGLRDNTVSIFAAAANGDATPAGTLTGSDTGISAPLGMAFDSANELVLSNFGGESVTVYAAGATGDAVPVRTITGSNTLIAEAYGLAVDANNTIYVVDNESQFGGTDAVSIFAAGANGNVAPTRQITGSNTGMTGGATYDAVDAQGNLYVSNTNAVSVVEFGPTANGNATPIATIAGSLTGLVNPTGIAVDTSGNIYVADETANEIFVYAKGANGNVMPIRTIVGSNTGFSATLGIKIGP